MPSDDVLRTIDALPARPGCYLFKDRKGAVVYVGKAKSLRARVRSYFQPEAGDERYFVPLLGDLVGDVETIVTASEMEAAILEDTLVKKHRPRFNVKLRDDKSFLCLRIATRAEWPRVEIVRGKEAAAAGRAPGVSVFGPFHSATAARRTLHLVNKHFQLRTCTDADLASRKRPCLQYQIRRCRAPCVFDVDRASYAQQVRAVGMFLAGRHDELVGEIEDRMREASRALEYEAAATYRDQLRAVEAVRQEQRVSALRDVDQDVVGLARDGDAVEIAVLFVRKGKVTDAAGFGLRGAAMPDAEVVAGFLAQYYREGAPGSTAIPDEVVVPVLPDGADGVALWLAERRGATCEVVAPKRGPRADLCALAADNAAHALDRRRRARDDAEARLGQLQRRLRLPDLPRRIECCDISHHAGQDTVGAIVALRDAEPDKSRYRTFLVRGVAPGDDYGATYQVLARRFRRARAAGQSANPTSPSPSPSPSPTATAAREAIDWDLPDLFVVDGGRGQLQVALAAARDLGLHDLPIVALAKERVLRRESPKPLRAAERTAERSGPTPTPSPTATTTPTTTATPTSTTSPTATMSHGVATDGSVGGEAPSPAVAPPPTAITETVVDRVFLPGQKNGIPLRPGSAALQILARARDEAHRFANRGRLRLERVRTVRSALDDVPGIGPATRAALLRALGSVEAVRAATDEELLAVPGVTRRVVEALRGTIAPRPGS